MGEIEKRTAALAELPTEHQALVVSMTQKLMTAVGGGGVAVVMVHVADGRAEMLHVGPHDDVESLMRASFDYYMQGNAPFPTGAKVHL